MFDLAGSFFLKDAHSLSPSVVPDGVLSILWVDENVVRICCGSDSGDRGYVILVPFLGPGNL